tara:strand:+ start:1011 stop:2225 length:1215 start_codon:yes stop_codon:yes gene_type:complete
MTRNLGVIFICSLFFISNVFSQGVGADIDGSSITGADRLNTITTAVPFLMISPDSRAGGMGDVGVATTPDANSLHWNPAKYAFVDDQIGFSVSYVPWLRALVPDINLSYLSGYTKLNDNEAIGMELRYFSLGNITFTDITGTTIGQYKPNEFTLGTAYSRKLSDNFSLAISGRYIYSNLTGGQLAGGMTTVPGQSIAADIAGYFEKPIMLGKQEFDLALGWNVSNIGNKISYTETSTRDFIPINLRLGTAIGTNFDDYNKMSIAFDINKLLVPTPPEYDVQDQDNDGETDEIISGKDPNVSVVSGMFQSFGDAPGGFKEELREINFSIGTEYWYANQFAIRGGYFHEHNTKGGRKFFTFGSGVKYNVFELDFSYLINASRAINGNNPLANTMRFTLIFDFGELN